MLVEELLCGAELLVVTGPKLVVLEIETDAVDDEDVMDDMVNELELLELEEATAPCKYSSTRLLPPSHTHRFPEASKATPSTPYRVDWVALVGPATDELAVRSGSPITREAFSPIDKGCVNSSTLPKVSSDTQRFPALSNVRSSPKPIHPALGSTQKRPGTEFRFGTPRARLALSPVESGLLYSKILPPWGSATQRFPEESNATAVGPFKLVGDVNALQLCGQPGIS